MYKNQLQELAQRSCFNLPAYGCFREGPDHAPRFKATVNFNGEAFESPTFCSTLRQAEHAAAEVALNVLSKKGPSKAMAAKVLDETGVYKNLLQETVHRAGLKLPVYTTVRSGPGHVPFFSCTVELAGMTFIGETAKTKKQAQKNAAMTAWSSLKKLSKSGVLPSSSPSPISESGSNDEQEQVTVACYLATLPLPKTKKASPRFQHLRHNSAPSQRDISGYSLHQISWPHSQISPEASVHQSCLQDRACHNQNHLLALSPSPTSPYKPQIVPFTHSVQPDCRQYFLSQGPDPITFVPGTSPFLYFSMHPESEPVKSISQISIQEIEEKQLLGEEWFNDDIDTNEWGKFFQSAASRPSPNTAINIFDSHKQRPHERMERVVEEKSSRTTLDPGFTNLLESNHIEQNCVPEAINSDKANLSLRSQHVSDSHSSATSIRSCLPASFAAPLIVQTATTSSHVTSIRLDHSNPLLPTSSPRKTNASTCPRRPWSESMNNVGVVPMPSHGFNAPAVHVRSVVPVCSAPPVKRSYPSIQDRPISEVVKNQVRPTGEIPGQHLDFGRLHM